MDRRCFLGISFLGLVGGTVSSKYSYAEIFSGKGNDMSLVKIVLSSPKELLGGWAALAAVCAARGWDDVVYATSNQWLYHDGGGNWACLRFKDKDQAILIGHDHEYSETYYGEAAKYFEEEETDLLKGAPDWWGFDLSPLPFGEWIGFVYGWDGKGWQRANYDKPDGFESVGLLDACSITNTDTLKEFASDAPGLKGQSPSLDSLKELVAANGNISAKLLENVVPGWDIAAGTAAANKFIQAG